VPDVDRDDPLRNVLSVNRPIRKRPRGEAPVVFAIDTIPVVGEKAAWALKWIGSNNCFAERLVAGGRRRRRRRRRRKIIPSRAFKLWVNWI
jgi:hypothetical protein